MANRIEKGHRTALDEALEAFAEVQAERAATAAISSTCSPSPPRTYPRLQRGLPLTARTAGSTCSPSRRLTYLRLSSGSLLMGRIAAVAPTSWRVGISSAMTGAIHWSAY